MSNEEKPDGLLETWAIIEVMGHSKYAGFVRQVPMGGAAMIRIDVPEIPEREEEYLDYLCDRPAGEDAYKTVKKTRKVPGTPAFTKFLGVSSIFAITPCSKEAAIAAVKAFRSAPVTVIDLPQRRALPSYRDDDEF